MLEVVDILEKATQGIPKVEIKDNVHLQHLMMTEGHIQKVFIKQDLLKVNNS